MEYKFGDVEIRLPELRVMLGGREIHMSLIQMRVLMVLLSDPCRVIPHEEIVRRSGLTDKSYLMTVIVVLRQKLEQKYIVSKRQYGYKFANELVMARERICKEALEEA